MKLARGLSFFVAVALVGTIGTACGKKEATAPTSDTHKQNTTPADVQVFFGPKLPDDLQKKAVAAGDPAKSKSDASKSASSGKSATGVSGQGTSDASDSSRAGGSGASSDGTGVNNDGTGGGTSSGGGSAPAPVTKPKAGEFQLTVTEYFGSSNVFDQSVGFSSGQNLLDAMRDHLTIETAYGGGFINSINGTKSGYTDKSIFTRKKRDWFYFINGSVASVGADSYQQHAGDAVWWDYHDWSGSGSNVPTVVGEYPHPFTSGYDGAKPGTVVYYSGNHAGDANRIAQSLRAQGAGNVSTAAYADGAVKNPSTNAIVVGTWSELGNQSAIQSMFSSATTSGLYASFEDGAVTMLNYQGKSADRTGQAAILATGSGSGDTTPTWLVIGANDSGLEQAVNLMVNSPNKLRNKVGVVLSGGEAVEVPVAQ
ncbi:MAG: DUF4430 domain-containing protein [Tumebacillaceae bacterium]